MANLSGTIDRIIFHNKDNGYVVLRVQAAGFPDSVTVVGNLPTAVAGEFIDAEGDWIVDMTHGRQFKANTIKTTPPHTIQGIEKYLGSGLIQGIGPAFAKKIVAHFKEKTLEIIDQSPTHLSEIKGIGPSKMNKIRRSWEEQRGLREIMVFLQSYGIGQARALRIHKIYGDRAVEMIKQNPYRLTQDIWGIGFKTADEVARNLGLPLNSPQRARAAVRFVLQESSQNGHVGFPEPRVLEQASVLTDIPSEILQSAIQAGIQDDEWIRDRPKPEDLAEAFRNDDMSAGSQENDAWLFLKPLFLAENSIANSLQILRQGEHPLPDIDSEKAMQWVEEKMGIQFAESQKEAIRSTFTEKVIVIRGGPGVGKTTIVRGIIEIFQAKKLTVALGAPTGRAAKRLSESTGQEAKTIHRLLEYDAGLLGFVRDRDNPIDCDLLVVDEASMVDVTLMHHLLRAIPPWACLVIVGDVDQLPSVGPGSVLADLIASKTIKVVQLKEIFRQAAESHIIRAAHAINSGEEPQSSPPGTGDFYFVEANEPPQIIEKMVAMLTERIPAKFGLDPKRDVQVLSPMNKTELGVRNLNQVLQEVLNPRSDTKVELERFGVTFRVGDKVLQTENDYTKEVYNGDIGMIVDIDEEYRELFVQFENKEVKYEYSELDSLVHAFATSIHKSQGSEFPAVIIPLHTQHFVMLKRNLLYTGITRGKKLVVVVGSRKALWLAVRSVDSTQRYSMLRWRLKSPGSQKLEPRQRLNYEVRP
ncbi:ATP-dependent RecD-like DNA helicase [Telmatocola sphagniphila]|uniref:ATP-dependent RecD-like DNA helicase n=1 Tax=Telmatocola sphagniphila TaxID=1123043 RepID=A0A8E6B2I4_9BACT|nr:ATP-dependent RecD-like DNA helicase [Telmatocola sphagniphila]QVL30642.1 ATP-dependent RecD-like DNA helicase [Telmatocola sphagniphila]